MNLIIGNNTLDISIDPKGLINLDILLQIQLVSLSPILLYLVSIIICCYKSINKLYMIPILFNFLIQST